MSTEPGTRLSELPLVPALDGSGYVPVTQGGLTYRAPTPNLGIQDVLRSLWDTDAIEPVLITTVDETHPDDAYSGGGLGIHIIEVTFTEDTWRDLLVRPGNEESILVWTTDPTSGPATIEQCLTNHWYMGGADGRHFWTFLFEGGVSYYVGVYNDVTWGPAGTVVDVGPVLHALERPSRLRSVQELLFTGALSGGQFSLAHGSNSHAEGTNSHAHGSNSHAEGTNSHAEGYASHAEGSISHAEGYASHAEGYASHAEGQASHAEGRASHAEGDGSHAEGQASHAEGRDSIATGGQGHAEGYGTHAEGWNSHAEGAQSHAQGQYSHAEGYRSHARWDGAHAAASNYFSVIGDAQYERVVLRSTSNAVLFGTLAFPENFYAQFRVMVLSRSLDGLLAKTWEIKGAISTWGTPAILPGSSVEVINEMVGTETWGVEPALGGTTGRDFRITLTNRPVNARNVAVIEFLELG